MEPSANRLTPGDRIVVTADVPAAGLKAGELCWISKIDGDQLMVLRADGSVATRTLLASQVKRADVDDVAKANGVRPPQPKAGLPTWFMKYVRPLAALGIAVMAYHRLQTRNAENPPPEKPAAAKVQTITLPKDRYVPPRELRREGE